MKKDEIMSVSYRLMTKPVQYAVVYGFPGGQITRRLRDKDGKLIPSPGAYVEKGKVCNEKPEIFSRVHTAAAIEANKLGDENAFSTRIRWTYAQGMERYIKWRNERRNNPQFKGHAMRSVKQFGDLRITQIHWKDVADWIEILASRYSHNTVNHTVAAGRSFYNWLKKQRKWEGENPFAGHEWRAKKEPQKIRTAITVQEWQYLEKAASADPVMSQAIHLGYFSGLRPSEIYRIRPEDINHRDLTLVVRVTKTGQTNRLIAIPQKLSLWLQNQPEWHNLNPNTIYHKFARLRDEHAPTLDSISMETFRYNFAHMMVSAGCDIAHVDFHMGHKGKQHEVLKTHYLKERTLAVELMRKWVAKVFDSELDSGKKFAIISDGEAAV